MTTHQYIIAWAVYLFGALGCLAVWWRMTRPFGQGFPRRFLRLVAAFAILTPAISNPGMSFMGPALLVCLFDGLSHGPEAMLRTTPVIFVSLLVATLLAALGGLFIKTPKNDNHSEQPQSTNRPRKEPAL